MAYTRIFAPLAMPLVHSTSSVSSPLTAGSVVLLTLIVVRLLRLWDTLLAVQNFVTSLVLASCR